MNLTRTLTTALAAAALTAATLTTPAPAQAAGSTVVCQSRDHGRSQDVIKVCLQANYTVQNDGTGVTAHGFKVTVPKGCSYLEDFNPMDDTDYTWTNPGNGNVIASTSGGVVPDCSHYFTRDDRGADKGSMVMGFRFDVRVNNGNDRRFGLGIKLNPNYTSSEAFSYDVDDTSRAAHGGRVR